jgi:aspartate/methionine/tyrosine aminotransferase
MNIIANHLQSLQQSSLRKIISEAPANAINLALGEIHFPASQLLIKEAENFLQTNPLRYTENAGLSESREAVAAYYDGIIKRENVCLTCGAQEALFSVLFSILNPNDEIIIADPTFLAYKTMLEMLGGKAVSFQLSPDNHFALDADSLQKAISPKTKAILLCNPSNPLGISFSRKERETIMEIAMKNHLWLIADEIYRELYFDKIEPSFLHLYENSIVISGLSKSHGLTGWRIGWFASRNAELIKKITVSHQYICTSAPTLAQKIIPFALSQNGMDYVAEIREFLRKNKSIALTIIKEIGLEAVFSYHAPYLFINVKGNDEEFSANLSKRGVIVVPGSIFGKNGSGFIRLNYGIPEDKLKRALEILQNFKFIY